MAQPSETSGNPELGPRPVGARHTADQVLLAPRAAGERQAFTRSDPWRALRILGEFVEGFDALSDLDWAVTLFGSARVKPGQPAYDLAVELGREFGQAHFAVITGGGPGVMGLGAHSRQALLHDVAHALTTVLVHLVGERQLLPLGVLGADRGGAVGRGVHHLAACPERRGAARHYCSGERSDPGGTSGTPVLSFPPAALPPGQECLESVLAEDLFQRDRRLGLQPA